MRKLVKLAYDGSLTEIDRRALEREARDLVAAINAAPPEERKRFQYRERILPFIKAALDGSLRMPHRGGWPYVAEELFDVPNPVSTLYCRFALRVEGSPSTSSIHRDANGRYIPRYARSATVINGENYEECDFED